MTLQESYLFYVNKLKNSQINNYHLESRIIFQHVLGISYTDFILSYDNHISEKDKSKIDRLFERRILGTPLAYLINKQYFWKNDFYVNENVLIPRLDSETLVLSILKFFVDKTQKLKILEIGVGSGCLILSLLKEYKKAFGVGVDISKKALDVAKINRTRLDLKDRLNLYQSNIFQYVQGKFDIIISNPPYIDYKDRDISKEVRDFEPATALFAKNKGLFFYYEIMKYATYYLNNNGYIFFEIGYKQKTPVIEAIPKDIYKYIGTYQDLNKRDRVIVLQSLSLNKTKHSGKDKNNLDK